MPRELAAASPLAHEACLLLPVGGRSTAVGTGRCVCVRRLRGVRRGWMGNSGTHTRTGGQRAACLWVAGSSNKRTRSGVFALFLRTAPGFSNPREDVPTR